MSTSEPSQSSSARSHSRFRQVVVPLVVLVLLGQFAPVGLLTSHGVYDGCPHCSGSEGHGTHATTKCVHSGRHAATGDHGAAGATRHSSSHDDEPSFCGCGADDTTLTILPAIGKTLVVAEFALPFPSSHDLVFSFTRDDAEIMTPVDLFHPPRLV